MKSLNQMICILISSLFLMCNTTIETTAQTIAGKWSMEGTPMALHFSKEGALYLTADGSDTRQALYYIADGQVGVVYLDESDLLYTFTIEKHTNKKLILTDSEGTTLKLNYEGRHEIPQEYVQLVVENFGDELGGHTGFFETADMTPEERDLVQMRSDQANNKNDNAENNDDGIYEPNVEEDVYVETSNPTKPRNSDYLKNPDRLLQNMRPDDLSLVGCWEAEVSGDPYVFDENGFWRTGNFDGSYNYGYEGLYNFDGRTLTVHVHSGGGLTMTVGETYTYPIENLSSRGLNFVMGKDYNGDYYKPRYQKTNRYQLTTEHKANVQANINKKRLEKTKWVSGNTEYLFLDPNYLIIRKNGDSQQRQWLFAGNTLWVKEISGRDDDYTKIGEVTSWTGQKLVTDGSNGKTIFKKGDHKVANLSTNEQTTYINYLRLYHANYMQAMMGVGVGMDYYEVVWH